MDLPATGHDPVLLAEVLDALRVTPGKLFVDCTTGRGGHAKAVAERLSSGGQLIALDVDPVNLAYARERLGVLPARFFHANFAELPAALAAAGVVRVDGILADLGISTNQLFEPSYGLSFARDTPLDMRLDPRLPQTAADIVNRWPEQKIADSLFQLADERFSRRIARKVVEVRRTSPINTTEHLADLVRSVVPPVRSKSGRRSPEIDPATRTFLALRMLVNRELENLQALLVAAADCLKPGGRLAIISFHSTEDRVVKQTLKQSDEAGRLKLVTRKPLVPSEDEIRTNPRSRSAKLRVAEKPEA